MPPGAKNSWRVGRERVEASEGGIERAALMIGKAGTEGTRDQGNERIEVRGSAEVGVFAFSGSVVLVTRQDLAVAAVEPLADE